MPVDRLAVVGGGPAGLATAIGARLRGLRAVVVERRTPPLDKPCGEGLMPDAVASLERLGVDVAGLRSAPFLGIRYFDGDTVADGLFPGPPGRGVRRTALHEALVRRAGAVGVELLWGTEVRGLRRRTLETSAGSVRADWFAAADGLASPLRRQAGLEAATRGPRRFGVRRHFRVAPWSARVEVHWVDHAEAYVTPVAEDEVGVAILWSGVRAGWEELLRRFPRVVEHLAGAPPLEKAAGVGPLRRRSRRVVAGRLALVGDAAGYVDAITGEGLAVAFHQARALAEAAAAGDLAAYQRAQRRIVWLPDTLTRLLLFAERRPALRRRLVATLGSDPELFSRLLAVHARQLPWSGLGVRPALRLARGLLP